MHHPAELAIHRYLENATKGETRMSESTIDRIGEEIKDALKRQFAGGNKRDEFRFRMSNIGRPSCQLWFQKNHADKALPKPTTFVMNMMLGDIVEAVFKGLLTEAGMEYIDNTEVELDLDENTKIKDSDKFERCFEAEPEYFRRVPTGNTVLNRNCNFCDFRHMCYPTLRELPAQMSQAKEPKMVQYVKLRGEM